MSEWIPWHGGECPVPIGTLIDIRHRDGEEFKSVPALIPVYPYLLGPAFEWRHRGFPGDIIAYRLINDGISEEAETRARRENQWRDLVKEVAGVQDDHPYPVKAPVRVKGGA